ncbi:MAG: hypothetical protein AAGM67_20480, partial [Bacteroidota bacterium]
LFSTSRHFLPAQKWSLLIPGIEYRRYIGERMAWRLGGGYRPRQDWEFRSSTGASANFGGIGIQTGLQYAFVKPELLPGFQLFGFVEVGAARSRDELMIRDEQTDLLQLHSESLILSMDANVGIGMSYVFAARWIVRVESAYNFSNNYREIVDLMQQEPVDFGLLPQGALRYTSSIFFPINEISIGWRF